MRRGGGRDIRWLAAAIVAIEIAQLPLFAHAFGNEVLALLVVRLLLTIVLVALFLRKSTVAKMVLGSLRVMAFCVGFIMAINESGGVAWALGTLAVADGAAGITLLLLPSRS